MRYPASEKARIVRLVEQFPMPVKRTLEKLGIPRATFYRWCDLYHTGGPEALGDRSPRPDRVWNQIPDMVRDQIIKRRSTSRRSRRANAPCASPTRKAISCQRLPSIAC